MSEQKAFVGYEYKEITAPDSRVSQYLDCYECFGWQADGNLPAGSRMGQTTIRMKRDRLSGAVISLYSYPTKSFCSLIDSFPPCEPARAAGR